MSLRDEALAAGPTFPRFVDARPSFHDISMAYHATLLESNATTAPERSGRPHIMPGTGAASWSKPHWARPAKLYRAFGVMGLDAYAVLQDAPEITTDNPVISASTAALRIPSDGGAGEHQTRRRPYE